jgi:3-hydroxyisobutyrate dehydrogenase-like beta-hydroxyacid dehydrogenase
MARRLARALPLVVWNRNTARAHDIDGASVAETPRECVQNAQIVVVMVSDEAALFDVLDQALFGLQAGALVIDMSTTGRRAAISAAERVKRAGGSFVDAPVSGTVGPAERGELVAFVGGAREDVQRAQPVLEIMCKRVIHVGGVGQGQAMKVVLNGLGAHHLLAFTSMLALAERAGIAREIALEAFTQGAFATPSYIGKKAKVLARDWSPEFSLALTQKDARLNAELQAEVGMHLPVFTEIQRAIDEGIAQGLGGEDLFALEKIFTKRGT